MTTTPTERGPYTPDDLLRLLDERLYELVDGWHVEKHPISSNDMTTASTDQKTYTPDDLLRLSDERLYELVDGRLVEKKHTGTLACLVATNLAAEIRAWCKQTGRGIAALGVNYRCFPHAPDMIRRPDVSYISKGASE